MEPRPEKGGNVAHLWHMIQFGKIGSGGRVRSEAEKIQQKQRPTLCDSAAGATGLTSKRYNQGDNLAGQVFKL